jgi:hypothetical protein
MTFSHSAIRSQAIYVKQRRNKAVKLRFEMDYCNRSSFLMHLMQGTEGGAQRYPARRARATAWARP